MSDVVEQIKKENIMLTASPVKHEVMGATTIDVPSSAYRMCNSPYSPIGNSLLKPGKTKLSACGVSEDVSMCPVLLHPTKQLTSPVQFKTESLLKSIGFSSTRTQLTAQSTSRSIGPSTLKQSIMESQNIKPLIITPKPIHTNNDIVPAKIVPFPPASHFSILNKPSLGSYDSLPVFTGIRPSLLSGTPPIYTQSDFARFPPKRYQNRNSIINPAVVHSPIIGNNEELCLNISNTQHLFKPIISPRPSILRKRDADGLFRGQKHLLPIIKHEPDDCQNVEETSITRNGYIETSVQIESIMVPQGTEVVLPQITTISRQSRIMVEISPRKKPRKQLLPVNQNSTFQIINDEMEYVGESIVKIEKTEYYKEEIALTCAVNADDIDDDDFFDDDDMDMDDDFPGEDYDAMDDFENDFPDGLFEYHSNSEEKPPCIDSKPKLGDGGTKNDANNTALVVKNRRPTLLGRFRSPWRGQSHHFQRITDFKVKEIKKPLTEHQQVKKWMPETRNGWKVTHMLTQFEGMVQAEEDNMQTMAELKITLETEVTDIDILHRLLDLIQDNVQRIKVTKGHLDDISKQLKKILDYKSIVDDIVDKYCPKELIKKYPLFLDKH